MLILYGPLVGKWAKLYLRLRTSWTTWIRSTAVQPPERVAGPTANMADVPALNQWPSEINSASKIYVSTFISAFAIWAVTCFFFFFVGQNAALRFSVTSLRLDHSDFAQRLRKRWQLAFKCGLNQNQIFSGVETEKKKRWKTHFTTNPHTTLQFNCNNTFFFL